MKLLFLALLASFSISAVCQDNSQLARVKKVDGVEVYVMCEPLREYEVTADIGTGFKAESVVTGGLINKSISGRISQFVRKAKKDNPNVEAIIYSTGKKIVAVKFLGGTDKKGLAQVTKMKGMPVFVMNEPLRGYEVLGSKGGGIKWKSAMTAGLINNSIEEDVEKIVKKLDDVKHVEAFYFDGTKEGEAIKFK